MISAPTIRQRLVAFVAAMAITAFGMAEAKASSFQNETLKYVITYKWGIIHKEAGDATLTLRRSGDNYNLQLLGKSRPWADKIYRLRDTLQSQVRVNDFKVTRYVKNMHERNDHTREQVDFSYSGNTAHGKGIKRKVKKGVPTVTEHELTATGPVYDFLSIFYYLRKLDYNTLEKNKNYTVSVFSATEKETVKIRSLGTEKIKLRNGTEREAHHIQFNFTQKNGKKSSDDIDTWISTDSSHVPLYIVGKLPIGEIRVYLTSKS